MNTESPILTETEQTRTLIVDALHKGVCHVVFTKANGEERKMFCTLREDFLRDTATATKSAAVGDGTETTKPKRSPNTICVWDIEAWDWRSFKVETVKEWSEVETAPIKD